MGQGAVMAVFALKLDLVHLPIQSAVHITLYKKMADIMSMASVS